MLIAGENQSEVTAVEAAQYHGLSSTTLDGSMEYGASIENEKRKIEVEDDAVWM